MLEERYYLKDENDNFVWEGSIIKVANNYYYVPYVKFGGGCRRYCTYDQVYKILEKLNQTNILAGFNHKFEIIFI